MQSMVDFTRACRQAFCLCRRTHSAEDWEH